jgi:hypothetical protein
MGSKAVSTWFRPDHKEFWWKLTAKQNTKQGAQRTRLHVRVIEAHLVDTYSDQS